MAAPNWPTLYNFEDLIEAAGKAVLTAGSITGLNLYTQQDTGDTVLPAVSLQFSVRSAVEHYGFRAVDSQRFVDLWEGTLEAVLETDRARVRAAEAGLATHSSLRAAVRYHLASVPAWNAVAATSLPYHVIWKILEGASTPRIEAENDRDVSAITFNIMFGIRSDAWPAP